MIAACIIGAATCGQAATLGGVGSGIGAETKMIASCGTGMSFGYTTGFYAGLSRYAVNGIDLSNIPAGCLGKGLSVTFYDLAGNDVGSAVSTTLATSGTTQNIAIAPNADTIDASRVDGVSVVIP